MMLLTWIILLEKQRTLNFSTIVTRGKNTLSEKLKWHCPDVYIVWSKESCACRWLPFYFKDYPFYFRLFKRYRSELFISMQYFTGFLIMLCFTTTKKVRGLLKDGLFKRWNGKVETETSVTCDGRTGNRHVVAVCGGSNNFNMKSVSREEGKEKYC